jgi:hypothetical protein
MQVVFDVGDYIRVDYVEYSLHALLLVHSWGLGLLLEQEHCKHKYSAPLELVHVILVSARRQVSYTLHKRFRLYKLCKSSV